MILYNIYIILPKRCSLHLFPLHLRQERPPVGCGSRSVRSDVLLSEAADIMAEAEVHHLLAPLADGFGDVPWGFYCGCAQ